MKKLQSLDLLNRLLAGEEPNMDIIKDLIEQHVKEDLYIDYKHGNCIHNSQKCSEMIREYVSGFANSDGGILIIGINEDNQVPKEISGCISKDISDFARWVGTCLTPIASYFSLPPRFYTVDSEYGVIIIIAVSRSSQLIPVTKLGKMRYHFRMGDQTLCADDYLMSDLILGRRQHPNIDISGCSVRLVEFHSTREEINSISLIIYINIENKSFIWIEECLIGIITFLPGEYLNNNNRPGNHVLSFIEQINVEDKPYNTYLVSNLSKDAKLSRPFSQSQEAFGVRFPTHHFGNAFSFYWSAAIYIIPKGSEPLWYQLKIKVDNNMIGMWRDDKTMDKQSYEGITWERLTSKRPLVGWEGFELPR